MMEKNNHSASAAINQLSSNYNIGNNNGGAHMNHSVGAVPNSLNNTITFKVLFKDAETRVFQLVKPSEDASSANAAVATPSFAQLLDKLMKVFSFLQEKDLNEALGIYFQDCEGDLVRMTSNEDLALAIGEAELMFAQHRRLLVRLVIKEAKYALPLEKHAIAQQDKPVAKVEVSCDKTELKKKDKKEEVVVTQEVARPSSAPAISEPVQADKKKEKKDKKEKKEKKDKKKKSEDSDKSSSDTSSDEEDKKKRKQEKKASKLAEKELKKIKNELLKKAKQAEDAMASKSISESEPKVISPVKREALIVPSVVVPIVPVAAVPASPSKEQLKEMKKAENLAKEEIKAKIAQLGDEWPTNEIRTIVFNLEQLRALPAVSVALKKQKLPLDKIDATVQRFIEKMSAILNVQKIELFGRNIASFTTAANLINIRAAASENAINGKIVEFAKEVANKPNCSEILFVSNDADTISQLDKQGVRVGRMKNFLTALLHKYNNNDAPNMKAFLMQK